MWQHAELTVTNSPFGLTIKSIMDIDHVQALECKRPVNIQNQYDLLGDCSEGVTPVPIPNTVVKPFSPDGTARASVWESRTSPGLKDKRPSGQSPEGLFALAPTLGQVRTPAP